MTKKSSTKDYVDDYTKVDNSTKVTDAIDNYFYVNTGSGGGGSSGIYTVTSSSTIPSTSTVTINPTTVTGSLAGFVGGAGGAGSGSYYSTSGWSNQYNANIKISGQNPKISTDKSEIDLDELAEVIKTLKERLLVIVPDFEKHEKYAALKKAYDHYKLIESMLVEEKKDV